MIWYVAKLFSRVEDQTDPDPNNWVDNYKGPGAGSPIVAWTAPSKCRYRIHAYDDATNTCLVGLYGNPTVPADWVAKTVAEAQAQFQTVVGRAPTAKEVF